MKLGQLQLLIEIVELGSMNEAAKRNYMARSSVSTSMKNLENELGGVVFDRSTKGTVLTAFGVDVYGQAKDIMSKMNYLQNLNAADSCDNLSVASLYCSLAYEAFIRLYSEVDRSRFTGDIHECGIEEIIQLVSVGRMNLGVMSMFAGSEQITKGKFENNGLEWNLLMNRKLYAVIGKKNPNFAIEKETVTMEELRQFPYIINYGATSEYSLVNFTSSRSMKRAEVRVDDLGCALRLVEETDGFLIETMDRETYRDIYHDGVYRFIEISGETMTCQLGWIRRKTHILSPTEQRYIQIMKELIEQGKAL